ncbi:MAG TPA: ABC-2 family transporter protein [Acetobacteraceae bacterium]|jgi:ABC-2 type transport system permease protein
MRLYVAEMTAAIRVSLADRTNFTLLLGGMVLNNGFVLLMWFMFFAGFRSVRGWQLADMALQIGVLAFTFGVAGVFAGGYRDMAAVILRGDLDAWLTQPRAVLPRLLAQESAAPAWGDVVVGVALLASAASLHWSDLPGLLFVLGGSLIVYLATGVVFASLAFWARGARSFARDLVEFVLLFGTWPGSIWSGATKLVVYTIVPAGFVVVLPVRFLRHPSVSAGLLVAAAALFYAALALLVFRIGLRRYRR